MHRIRSSSTISLLAVVWLFSPLPNAVLRAAETKASDARPSAAPMEDITVSWEPGWFDSEEEAKRAADVVFYINGRFVGFDEAGFKKIVERIGKLRRGTSVIWSVDPDLFGGGSGDEVVVPKTLYPALWKEFERLAQKRGVALSSATYAGEDDDRELPFTAGTEYVEPGTPRRPGEVILDSFRSRGSAWPVYNVDGKKTGHGRQGFLDTLARLRDLPAGTRLRVRERDRNRTGDDRSGPRLFCREFADLVAAKRFRLVVDQKKSLWPPDANKPARLRWSWSNFQDAKTPHAEVVYLVDGQFVGLGDAGLDAVLARIRKLPAGSYVEYPKYYLHAKRVDTEEREAFEAKDIVPFTQRRKNVDDALKQRRCLVGRVETLFWLGENNASDDYLDSLLAFATIVRDSRKPAKADAILTWTQSRNKNDEPTGPARYFVNGQPVGNDTLGFLAAIKRIEQLPDGAAVRIDPVGINTQAPFANPEVRRGQRHFEMTRAEDPFRGLIDVLADVARRKNLKVEVIPSEGRGNPRPNA